MPFGPHFDRRMKLASWAITAPIVYYMTFVEEYSHIEGDHCLVPVSEGGWKRCEFVFVAPLSLIPQPLRLYKSSNDLTPRTQVRRWHQRTWDKFLGIETPPVAKGPEQPCRIKRD
eukprot:13688_1